MCLLLQSHPSTTLGFPSRLPAPRFLLINSDLVADSSQRKLLLSLTKTPEGRAGELAKQPVDIQPVWEGPGCPGVCWEGSLSRAAPSALPAALGSAPHVGQPRVVDWTLVSSKPVC